jgi:thiol-disulfide isomerase/thioredoxin
MTKPTNAKRRPAPPPRPAAKKGARTSAPPPRSAAKKGTRTAPPPPQRPGWVIPAVVVGVVLALLAVAVVATRLGGDDGGEGAVGSELAETRPVTVSGEPLPTLPQGPDPAVGLDAPVVTGASFDGRPVEIGGRGRPSLVFFVAHWCPHCQREVPLLARELDRITPPGVEVLTVATSTREGSDNYPPSRWLEREGWTRPVLADDGKESAAKAYGLSGFPFFVLIGGDGKVAGRGSGEKSVAEVEALLKRVAPAG